MKTEALLEHLSKFHPKGYDLSLGRISKLLEKLGNPQNDLPPVFHIAGTNGKGSVSANLRTILEMGKKSVHTHTSPHLVKFHERYRIGKSQTGQGCPSEIVSDDMLAEVLGRVADANDGAQITIYELLAASMFILFSEQSADYAIVEVGLGGRFDATNVLPNPLVSIITSISLDHQSYLGDSVEKIAFEKAGIIKPGCPVVIAPQEDSVRKVLEDIATKRNCPIKIAGQDFDFYEEAGRFIYLDEDGLLDLPLPRLLGEHQLANSATAIAAIRMANCKIDEPIFDQAMKHIYWPGRLERLADGRISKMLSIDSEIWIDGGHNAAAGAVIADAFSKINQANPKPLIMICAMLNTKDPTGYLSYFKALHPEVLCVPIVSSEHGIGAEQLAQFAIEAGLDAKSCETFEAAIVNLNAHKAGGRILFCGSLYLVGDILKKNGTLPQ